MAFPATRLRRLRRNDTLRGLVRETELSAAHLIQPAFVIAAARRRFDVPIAAYQVSGEFAMIEAAARNGWIDRERIMLETLTSIQRAGAGMILTYFAKDVARLLA